MDTPLDTLRAVETPEGVILTLRVAGPVARALAFGLDFLGRVMFYVLVSRILSALGEAGSGLLMLVVFVTEWFYPVLFEVLWSGRTPGKLALSLAVVHADGRPVSWGTSLLRNLLLFVDFLPVGYLLGLISMLVSEDFRRLGDHVAGTVVVYRDTAADLASSAEEATPRAPRTPLRPDEQRALLAYADRRAQWSPERQEELQAILADVLAQEEPADPATSLAKITAWLRGGR